MKERIVGDNIKVYIGKVHDPFGEVTFQTMAMIDIGKLARESETSALYEDRGGIAVELCLGDTKVRMDRYDNVLVAIDADTAMFALYNDSVKYKCPPLLYAALMALRIVEKSYPDTKVVLYGY